MKRSQPFLGAALAVLCGLAAPAQAGPELDYMLHCRGCHGADGAGVPPDVPDLRNDIGRFVAIPEGREYVLRVPGVAQSELSDARTADVLNWIVTTLAALGADEFAPFSAEEVARFRRRPLTDVEAWRQRLDRHFE